MQPDILEDLGYLALGSRLKRLAERLQAESAKVHAEMGFPIQPSHFPLLAALDANGPLTVSQAVEALGASQPGVTRTLGALMALDLVSTRRDDTDSRVKLICLTDEGADLVARMKSDLWPLVRASARDLCAGPPADILEQLKRIETALQEKPMEQRVGQYRSNGVPAAQILRLREYEDSLAGDFYDITREWVEGMFRLEPNDVQIIENPREMIIDRGGVILFVEADDLGVIGTCAVMPVEGASFELTKMGVRESARGRKAGEFLLAETIARARRMKANGTLEEFFLLTNKKCSAAIHLYEKLGFQHDDKIMQRFGVRYARCDVAMSFAFDR